MGRTPQRVVDLLKAEIPAKISRNKFCIQTGINQNSIDKYMSGIAEPTQASMEKLANYFGVPVIYLRGEFAMELELAKELYKHHGDMVSLEKEMKMLGIYENSLLDKVEEYKELVAAFQKIPLEKMDEARDTLMAVQRFIRKKSIGQE